MSIAAERLERWVARVFANGGMPQDHAQTVARVLVWADLRGIDTHGVVRVPRYMQWLRSGELNARPAMAVRSEAAASVVLEADRAAGPVAMQFACELAMSKAKAAGIGLCLVRATTHTAALGYYTHQAAAAGMAAIAYSASGPNMAYHNAAAAGVSTAPLALAVPGDEGPVAVDLASGVVSLGRLALARRNNEALAPGWALDAQGLPTSDPHKAKLPLPLGGAKGSGLALLIECLTSLLAGNPLLAEALEGTPPGRLHRQNGAVIALDIARFAEPRQFAHEVARLARAVRALPPQPASEVLLPGERGARNAAQRRRDGIPLPAPVLEELRALSRSLNMEEL